MAISEQTFHRSRAQYGGMAKRLKLVAEEDKRLKKLLSEAELDKAIVAVPMPPGLRTSKTAIFFSTVTLIVSSGFLVSMSKGRGCSATAI